jgi:hypothetical protein
MYPQRRRMVSRALGLGLLAALVVLALSACGGGEKQQESKPRPLPEDPKALRPGEYRSEEFKPSLSFRVGKGWSSAPLEASDVLVIAQGETKVIGFVNAQEVYKPTKTGTPNVVDAPEDMVGWFQQHPYLQTDKPEPVTVGGVKGVQFDVVVEDLPEDYSGVCLGCGVGSGVGIFSLSTGYPVAFREADKSRLIVLEDVKGETVTVGFSSPATEFDEFAPEAQKVVDSVKWIGS